MTKNDYAAELQIVVETCSDTDFTDKLMEAVWPYINLAGMTEGEFTVVDVLKDEDVQPGQPIFGPLTFKFRFEEGDGEYLPLCYIYPSHLTMAVFKNRDEVHTSFALKARPELGVWTTKNIPVKD